MASEFLVPHQFRAVVWDIDDTLIDTAPSYLIGQREALARLGIPRLQIPHAVALWCHLLPRFGHTDRSTIFHAICIIFTPVGSPEAKPSPAGLLSCATALGVSPQKTCYIGDSTTDMIAANLAGMTPLLIGEANIPQFAIERPAHTASNLNEVRQWLTGRLPGPMQYRDHNRQSDRNVANHSGRRRPDPTASRPPASDAHADEF